MLLASDIVTDDGNLTVRHRAVTITDDDERAIDIVTQSHKSQDRACAGQGMVVAVRPGVTA